MGGSAMCAFVCVSTANSQKLQLLTTNEIQTPISHGSLVTEKLGLKMEIPSADWTEDNSFSRRWDEDRSESQHRQTVRNSLLNLLI